MKKKGIKVAKKLINLLMVLLILVSFITFGLSLFNLISFNVEVAKYVYVLIGLFLLPYEYLFTGKIDGVFQQQENTIYCFLISIALILVVIVVMVNSSKMFNGKYSSKKRVFAGILTCFILFLFFAIFTTSAIILTTKYAQFENSVNIFGPELIKIIKTNFGFNLIMIKECVVSYFGLLVCFMSIIFFVVGMSHKSTKVKILTSINFYSSEYEEKKPETKEKDNTLSKEVIKDVEIPESNINAKNLINKIMQLEELKKAGKISNTDYTRLRQKAIKRYKN